MTATVALIARDSVMSFAYTWAFDGRPQDGLILLVPDSSGERITAAWVDSWHPENQMMQYGRRIEPDGSVRVRGTYPAPPGPDWGWRIEFEPPHEGLLRVKMVSLPPEGQDQVAVEAEFTRNL